MSRNSGYGPPQAMSSALHTKPRKRSPLTRAVVAGGAVICIGAAYEVTAPTVHALSIVFRSPDGNGGTNEVRVNVLQGNIFDPQLGILAPNLSNNSTSAAGTTSTPNNPLVHNVVFDNPITRFLNALLSAELVFGRAATGPINNTTQISFLSFNVFNPQASIFGGNLSHNTAVVNEAVGNGNYNNASVTSVPNLWTSWFGGMTGNGNSLQLAFLSGNIFNPQWSLFGPNVSNNTAITNVANYNGNYSQTNATGGGLFGAVMRLFLGGMTGNGNTTQVAGGTSNITNPQVSIGGSNVSNNTATTNEAIGNGNSSQTTVSGPGSVITVGTTGNGNTNQTAVGTSNIENSQVSLGDVGLSPRPDELSASQSGSQLASTSTTPTASSLSSADSQSSSSANLTSSSGSSTAESGSGTSGSGGTTGTTGTGGTTGTSGSGGTSGAGGADNSSGSGDSGGSGGE